MNHRAHREHGEKGTSFLCVLCVLCGLIHCVLCVNLFGAEITSGKMAILNTEQGKVTLFEDNVSIVDGNTKISAGRVEFYDQQNMAIVQGGLSIVTPTSTVTADSAQYLLGARKTYLYRNVMVNQEGLRITAQALMLDNAANQVQTESDLLVVDEARGIEISGHGGSFDLGTEDGEISGSPKMVLRRSDSMTVTGQYMQMRRAEHYAMTTGKVVAQSKDANLTCDTLVYFLDADSARATGEPELKQGDNTIIGRLMSFGFDKGELKRIDVAGDEKARPRLVQKDGEMTGRQIAIQFEKGELAQIAVDGDSGNQPVLKQERSVARGDRIIFLFAKGEADRIDLEGQTSGTYYTDENDRVEVSGGASSIRFRAGKPSVMEIADVREGRLYRHSEAQ